MIDGVVVTNMPVLPTNGGEVYRCLRSSDHVFEGFGEVYLSRCAPGIVKKWKRHNKMTLNIVVPVGSIRFVLFDDRPQSVTDGMHQVVKLSRDNYCRLTVPPGVWMNFQGLEKPENILINVTDLIHSTDEVSVRDRVPFNFDWSFEK